MNSLGQDRILNEVRAVDQAIDETENELARLGGLQSRNLADPDTSPTSTLRQEIDAVSQNILVKYRGLVKNVKDIKSDRESCNIRNSAQVEKVNRRLKTAIKQYQQLNHTYRKKTEAQIARQYRIVRPNATEAEVREVIEDTDNQQVFSQALIQSDRRGNAQHIAKNVGSRHTDIRKIEQDTVILAGFFLDLEVLIEQQEPAVTNIEQRGVEINNNVQGVNTELNSAVEKARAARRRKWYCLGICVLIIIIVVVVVLVVVKLSKSK